MFRTILWSRTFVKLALCHLNVIDFENHLKTILKSRLDLLESFPTEILQTRSISDINKELWIMENLLGILQNAVNRRVFPSIVAESEGLKLLELTVYRLKDSLCSNSISGLAKQVGSLSKWQAMSDSVRFFEGKCSLMRAEADGNWKARQKKLLEKLKKREESKLLTVPEKETKPEEGEIFLKRKRTQNKEKTQQAKTKIARNKPIK